MKKALWFIVVLCTLIPMFSIAQNSRSKYGDQPTTILDKVVKEANKDIPNRVQETSLNDATTSTYGNSADYKIAGTLNRFRQHINPYMQYALYVGLSIATILLIYNGLLMVTNAIHKEGDTAKVKKNVINIVIGVLILTGFYFIVKLAVALITSIFGDLTGSTNF